MRRLVASVLALLVPVLADATCTQWLVGNSSFGNRTPVLSKSGPDKQAVCLQFASADVDAYKTYYYAHGGPGSYQFRVQSGSVDGSYSSGSQCRYTMQASTDGGATWSSNGSPTASWVNGGQGACVDDPCSHIVDLADKVVVAGASSAPGGSGWCLSDDGYGGSFNGGLYGNGCAVTKAGSGISTPGHWFGQLHYTGSSCPYTPPPASITDKSNCVSTAGGLVCVSTAKTNCGTFNGDQVCLDSVPPGRCVLTPKGGAVCESTATAVPTTDGTTHATPVMSVTNTVGATTNTYNYYSSAAVVASPSPVVAAPATSESGSQPVSGDGQSQSLDDLEGGDLSAASEYGDSLSAFWGEIQDAPIVMAVSAISISGTGSCPSWTTTVEAGAFGHYVLDFTPMCSLWETIAPVISAVMLALWAFAGIRILLSA